MKEHSAFIGHRVDSGEQLWLELPHLTTHAVCVGMTGSGKTGLGIVLLEELARHRVPMIIVDLKGDMVDLLLNFPDLDATSFAPWLAPEEVAGGDPSEVAAALAARWRSGLEGTGLGPQEMMEVRDRVQWQLLTPGVASLAPLDILPSLAPPSGLAIDANQDAVRERVDAVVSAILSLIDRAGDPLTSREHVLVARIILDAWQQGRALDLETLVREIASPAFDALGALPLETFFPRDQRLTLVLALNTLLASPAFAAWSQGVPLTMEELLGPPGAPRATILSIAHLDQRQRLFVLSLVASELLVWTRRQPAASQLRALLYIDEVQGILPPHPANPPTKGPLLTLLKQGRAFGVGVWLATQNPIDLDYKAVGNAGIQVIGRLITDRDRDHALDGLGLRSQDQRIDATVAALDKRQFVLYDVRSSERLSLFSSRWAMSYLRGPVTLAEMAPLVAPHRSQAERVEKAGHQEHPPLLASPFPVRFAVEATGLLRPALVIQSELGVASTTLGLARTLKECWRAPVDETGAIEWAMASLLDEAPELTDQAPAGSCFPTTAPPKLEAELKRAEEEFLGFRAYRALMVLANRALKCVAEPGEDRAAFVARCLELADRADDRAQEQARSRYERKMATLKRRLERERDELASDRAQLEARKTEEKLGVAEGLLSVLLGSRSLRSAASKAVGRTRSIAGKHRMRQRAEAGVIESKNEIERIERELEDLADELQDEVDRIAAESEETAHAVEEVAVRPKRTDIAVRRIELVWE